MRTEQHILSEILLRKADSSATPIDGVFELTPICNMSCKMCYIRKKRDEVLRQGGLKQIDEWIMMAEEAKSQGLLFLLLTGGEIFTYPDFNNLYIELARMGFIISLNTNGTLITEVEANLLQQYPPRCINITLYGNSKQTYERLCGNGEAFSKVCHAIQLLKERKLNIKINVSLTPLNIEEFEEIYQFTQDNNIHLEATAYMFPPARRNGDGEFVRFSAEDAAKYTYYINRLCKADEMVEQQLIYNNLLNQKNDNIDSYFHMNCRGGHSSFWITWDGKLTPCGMMNTPCGYPFENGFKKAWEEVAEKVKKIVLSSKCAHCSNRKVCSVCVAKAIAETGRVDGTPEYLCKMTDEMNNIMAVDTTLKL